MTTKLIAACIQTNAAPDIATNLARIEPMIRDARNRGAELITLPENVNVMIQGRDRLLSLATTEDKDQTVAFFTSIAKSTGAWILAGSIGISTNEDRLSNRSLLFSPQGEIVARYNKIHMFDATLSDTESYRESKNFKNGEEAIIATTPWGNIGMTVCYDVRFPHLYRALAKAGADIITIPAAFTATTGKMHWHILTRARAIETGCFVLAPAQCGTHDGGRQTYGHSLIIAPNGEILAEAGEEPAVIMAELDMEKVSTARKMLPSLEHDRDFQKPA